MIRLAGAVRSTDTSPSTRPQNQNYYYNEYHEGIIEIASKLFTEDVVKRDGG